MLLTVRDAYTVDEKDAIAGALSLLGFKRTTASAMDRVKTLVDYQVQHGHLEIANGRLKINDTQQA